MTPFSKCFWSAAGFIHTRLNNLAAAQATVDLPEAAWSQLQKLQRQLAAANSRGFRHAASRITQQISVQLDLVHRELGLSVNALRQRTVAPQIASTGEIYADLVSLHVEFADVQVDFDDSHLSVCSEPIELDGLALGRFQIQLNWPRIGCGPTPYRVIALDPNPAAANDEVTHPHVNDQTLCAGEGRQPIESALCSGRIADFFLIVDRVLHTYSPGSAYIELADWNGVRCDDCGSIVSGDERSVCDRCVNDSCSDCTSWCDNCDRDCCGGCTTHCANCDQVGCVGCIQSCAACERDLCPECESEDLCPSCHETLPDDSENTSEIINEGTDTPLQPNSLVQATLLA